MTAPPPVAWVDAQFATFGFTHAAIVAIGLGVCYACGVAARKGEQHGSRAFADGFAGIVLGWHLLSLIWWLLPENWDVSKSLPLHVCDLNNLIIPAAIWTRHRLMMAVAVFWGLGLGTQAFVTPTVDAPPADLVYWMFWVGHLTIAAGCCVIAGFGFRPNWRDWRNATIISLLVLIALIVFNESTGANYGYVGNRMPSAKTLIDFLGPWPMRTVWLFLIASFAHALVVVCYPVLPRLLGVPARSDATP